MELNVRIKNGENDNLFNYLNSKSEYEIKNLQRDEEKINVIESLFEVELMKLIQPMIKGTNLIVFDICEKLSKTIWSRNFQLINLQIRNELYIIAMQVSAITGKDFANYLNSINGKIEYLTNSILKLLRNK